MKIIIHPEQLLPKFMDDDGNSVYSVFMFDDDLPALTSEEEVEIVYKILTKRDLYN
jgi:hypothetical protein